MASNKPKRTLKKVGQSQEKTEASTRDKFAETQDIVRSRAQQQSSGRISPQICCTVGVEEKKMLDELTLYASNKAGRVTNVSTVLRALIRLGYERKNELEFD